MTTSQKITVLAAFPIVTVFLLLSLCQCQFTRSGPGPSTSGPAVTPPMTVTNAPSSPTAPTTAIPGGTPSSSTITGTMDEPPIIVATLDFQSDRGGKAVIRLRGLNGSEYDRRIDVEEAIP